MINDECGSGLLVGVRLRGATPCTQYKQRCHREQGSTVAGQSVEIGDECSESRCGEVCAAGHCYPHPPGSKWKMSVLCAGGWCVWDVFAGACSALASGRQHAHTNVGVDGAWLAFDLHRPSDARAVLVCIAPEHCQKRVVHEHVREAHNPDSKLG